MIIFLTWLFLSISFAENKDNSSADPITSFSIVQRRIEASPNLLQELQTTQPNNHPKIYAEAGIWHETLESMATLRQYDPNNSTFITQWQDILKSVGLETVADAPLLLVTQPPNENKKSLEVFSIRQTSEKFLQKRHQGSDE